MHLFVQTQIKWKRLLKRSRAMFPCAIYSKRYPAKTQFLQQRRTQNCHVTREISIWSSLELYVCFPKLKYKTCKLGSTTTMSCVRSECIAYRIYKPFCRQKHFFFFLYCVLGTSFGRKYSLLVEYFIQYHQSIRSAGGTLGFTQERKVIESQCIELA